jgi:hypothetical protein
MSTVSAAGGVSVPEGRVKIARRFNAGIVGGGEVRPGGTVEMNRDRKGTWFSRASGTELHLAVASRQ